MKDGKNEWEQLWGKEVGPQRCIVCCIPFFVYDVALGDEVVPIMLRDLETQSSLWVWALPEITGANPVLASEGGNIRKMSDAWLRWGREKGLR